VIEQSYVRDETRRYAPSTRVQWLRANRGTCREVRESAQFLDSEAGQLYTVLHAAKDRRRAGLLMCGPFGVERESSHFTLVQWARTLAAQGIETMRFDYSGTGESSGRFEDMTISRWRENAELCAARLYKSAPGAPLVLHGVRLGALIAAELFAGGIGDGLLLWAPPPSARHLLWETLRHNLVTQRLASRGEPWKSREQNIAALEAGERVNVDGYSWSRELWRDAERHPLVLPQAGELRPWHVVEAQNGIVRKETTPPILSETVDADTFWASSEQSLVPRSEGFYRASLRWLDERGPSKTRAA
jgi:hypothetical protein